MEGFPSSRARLTEVEIGRLPEVADFAKNLSMLFKKLGISQRQYAARVLMDETVVSRYLNGRRVATQDFLDRLIKEVNRHDDSTVRAAAVEHFRNLRLAALRTVDPEAFEMENLRDQVDRSHRDIKRLNTKQEALLLLLERRENEEREAQRKFAEPEGERFGEWAEVRSAEIELRTERDRLESECGRLKGEIRDLREQLDKVRDLRQESEDRCSDLKQKLEAAELALAERQDLLGGTQRRREWDFAYVSLIEGFAATFVDVMRLLYVRTSPRARSVNIDRYEEFVKIATLHASALRSTIEGFATVLDPEAHGLCRRTEQRLLWMIDRLAEPPRAPVVEERCFALMNGVAEELVAFGREEGGRRYRDEQRAVDAALHSLGEFGGDGGGSGSLNDLWRYRLDAQSELLRAAQADSGFAVRGIRDDFDNRYSLGYFLLDSRLLPSACAILRSA